MRATPVLILAIAALAVVTFVHTATAASAVQGSCASVTQSDGFGNSRTWTFWFGNSAGTCTSSNYPFREVESGNVIGGTQFGCTETTSGAAPPSAAQTLQAALFKDDGQFPSASTTGAIWAQTFVGGQCGTFVNGNPYCTVDGASGGAPYAGTLRMWIRAARTSIPTYDVTSDSASTASYGIVHCNPRITAFTDGNTASSPAKYQGGDTLRTSVTIDSTPYNTGASVRVDVLCGAATNSPGSITVSTSAATIDQAIKGSSATWPDDCTLQQKLTITKMSSLSGFTSVPYFTWDTTNPITGVTYPTSTTAIRDAPTLDRTLLLSSCSATKARIGAGLSQSLTCSAADPRGNALPNGRLATCYTHRSSTSLTDTTDAPSTSATADATSSISYAVTLDTDATDTNSTTSFDYETGCETYGASRTASELYNYGNGATVFDVSTTLAATNTSTFRNVCGGAYPSTLFWISHHVMCSTVGPVQDPLGATVTRSLTFTRTLQRTGGSLTIPTETGVTSGTSSATYSVPQTPTGTWWLNTTVTDGLGNTGTDSKTVTFTDTDPGDVGSAGGDGDPVKISAGYSWERARVTVAASASFASNGTRRAGIADQWTIVVRDPTNTTIVSNLTLTESPAGLYVGAFNPGQPPALGVWTVYASVRQPDGADNASSVATVTIATNSSDPYGLAVAILDRINATYASALGAIQYGNAQENSTQALALATQDYLARNTNSTTAPLATSAALTDALAYLDANEDANAAATQALALAIQNYLGLNQNATTAPLATSSLVLAVQSYLALQGNATNASLQAALGAVLASIQDANNTASGALSYASFALWDSSIFSPARATLNDTSTAAASARDTSEANLRETRGIQVSQERGFRDLDNQTRAQGASTRAFLPAKWVGDAWAQWGPESPPMGLLLIAAVALALLAIRSRKALALRAGWFGGSLACLAAYAWSMGAFA